MAGYGSKLLPCGRVFRLLSGRDHMSISIYKRASAGTDCSWSSFEKASFILGNELWEECFESLFDLGNMYGRKGNVGYMACAQCPSPQSSTGVLWDIAGVKVQNGKGSCQGGKPGTGKLYNDVCLCGSTHSSGCVVDSLSATAA